MPRHDALARQTARRQAQKESQENEVGQAEIEIKVEGQVRVQGRQARAGPLGPPTVTTLAATSVTATGADAAAALESPEPRSPDTARAATMRAKIEMAMAMRVSIVWLGALMMGLLGASGGQGPWCGSVGPLTRAFGPAL